MRIVQAPVPFSHFNCEHQATKQELADEKAEIKTFMELAIAETIDLRERLQHSWGGRIEDVNSKF